MFRHLFAALLAATTATLPVAAEVTIETATGAVALPGAPARPVVYDLAAVDTLLALGVLPAGVPDLPAAPIFAPLADVPRVGTLFEPDLEALAALAPDLIVVGGRSAAKAPEVAPVGPVIDMTTGTDIASVARARVETWGNLFGKQAEAARLTADYDARLAEVRALARYSGKALVVMVNGTKMSAYGIGSRMGWLDDLTGLPEAKPGLSTDRHGNAISHEFIAETDPDWIFVIDRSAAIGEATGGAQAALDNPLVAGTRAAQAGHIVYLSSWAMYLSAGGYQSTMQILDELAAALKG